MAHPHSELASALHRAADLLIERELSDADRSEALTHIEHAVSALERGAARSEQERIDAFLSQMIPDAGAPTISPGDSLDGFAASPYSGEANALRPTSVSYTAIERGVRATITMGYALEGRPGRAHGGATAAVFDDVMGAVQRTIDRSGYTRRLTIDYYKPLPVDSPVEFTATFAGEDKGRFTVEATAKHDGVLVAAATGIFTQVSLETFGAVAADN